MIPIRDTIPARQWPMVNTGLIVVNAVVFLRQRLMTDEQLDAFVQGWGAIPARVLMPWHPVFEGFPPGAWLTVLTYMFLHGGWMHLIGNLWALWLFGDNVEDRLGHRRYLLFYLLCGLLAILAHIALNPASPLPTVGASGAIAGVMGAYFLSYPRARMIVMIPIFFYPLFFEVPAALYLLFWIVSQVFGGTVSLIAGEVALGGVAFWAHAGGFFAGMGLVRRLAPRRRARRIYWARDERF